MTRNSPGAAAFLEYLKAYDEFKAAGETKTS